MIAPLISLPCTARELENALHVYCDHHGAWDATIDHDISGDGTECLALFCAPCVSAATAIQKGDTK